jgi:hypothetical protein
VYRHQVFWWNLVWTTKSKPNFTSCYPLIAGAACPSLYSLSDMPILHSDSWLLSVSLSLLQDSTSERLIHTIQNWHNIVIFNHFIPHHIVYQGNNGKWKLFPVYFVPSRNLMIPPVSAQHCLPQNSIDWQSHVCQVHCQLLCFVQSTGMCSDCCKLETPHFLIWG